VAVIGLFRMISRKKIVESKFSNVPRTIHDSLHPRGRVVIHVPPSESSWTLHDRPATMLAGAKTRATPRNQLSRKLRAYALTNEEFLRLEQVLKDRNALAELAALAEYLGVALPDQLRVLADELEAERLELVTLPVVPRLRRSTRLHLYKTVPQAMSRLRNQRHEFIDRFLFAPEQVTQLAQLLFPNGFRSPGHGGLGSSEATLMLLAVLRSRWHNSLALGQFLDRDPDNTFRHFNNMVLDLDRRYRSLLDIRMLSVHAGVDEDGVARNVPIWQRAIEQLYEAKFPGIQQHEYFDGVCLLMDGLRQDLSRCSFGHIEEITFSGYTGRHDLVWGVLAAPNGMTLALLGPYTGRHNDCVFCTPDLQNAVREIGAKVLGDGIFPVRDWLRPLPSAVEKENNHIADNQVAAASAIRMPIEWINGDAQASFPFTFSARHNKILQSDVACRLRVTFLLRNLYTLMNGSGAAKYFSVRQMMSPEDYLARANNADFEY